MVIEPPLIYTRRSSSVSGGLSPGGCAGGWWVVGDPALADVVHLVVRCVMRRMRRLFIAWAAILSPVLGGLAGPGGLSWAGLGAGRAG